MDTPYSEIYICSLVIAPRHIAEPWSSLSFFIKKNCNYIVCTEYIQYSYLGRTRTTNAPCCVTTCNYASNMQCLCSVRSILHSNRGRVYSPKFSVYRAIILLLAKKDRGRHQSNLKFKNPIVWTGIVENPYDTVRIGQSYILCTCIRHISIPVN